MKHRLDILHERAIEIRARLREDFPQYREALAKVHFEWSNAMTRAAGKARPSTGMVRFSIPIWANGDNNFAEFDDTVLHEIAHVIAGPRAKHGPVWRGIALEIGCNGERCHTLAVPPRERYEHPCEVCGRPMMLGRIQVQRARGRRARYRHKECR